MEIFAANIKLHISHYLGTLYKMYLNNLSRDQQQDHHVHYVTNSHDESRFVSQNI